MLQSHAISEVSFTTADFYVDDICRSQVSLSFDKKETRPGESLNLEVTADAGSYVGLLAIDQSVLLLKGGNDITQSDVSTGWPAILVLILFPIFFPVFLVFLKIS